MHNTSRNTTLILPLSFKHIFVRLWKQPNLWNQKKCAANPKKTTSKQHKTCKMASQGPPLVLFGGFCDIMTQFCGDSGVFLIHYSFAATEWLDGTTSCLPSAEEVLPNLRPFWNINLRWNVVQIMVLCPARVKSSLLACTPTCALFGPFIAPVVSSSPPKSALCQRLVSAPRALLGSIYWYFHLQQIHKQLNISWSSLKVRPATLVHPSTLIWSPGFYSATLESSVWNPCL